MSTYKYSDWDKFTVEPEPSPVSMSNQTPTTKAELPERLRWEPHFGLIIDPATNQDVGTVHYAWDKDKGRELGPELVKRYNAHEEAMRLLRDVASCRTPTARMEREIAQFLATHHP